MSRAAVVNFNDLIKRVKKGDIFVATDVFPEEPLEKKSRFWTHPNVIVTPHTASQTTPRSAAEFMAKNIRLIEEGKPPIHVLNKKRGY